MERAKKRARGHRGSGTIVRIKGDIWTIRHVRDGKRVCSAPMSYPEATKLLANARRALAAGLVPAPYPMREDAAASKLEALEAMPDTFANRLPAFWDWRESRGNKSVRNDINRWKHLESFNNRVITSITEPDLQGIVDTMQGKDLSPASIGLVINLLSSFYKFSKVHNPVSGFKQDFGKVLKSDHDPEDTPFVKTEEEAKAIFDALPAPYSIAYAISRWAGLRPGEVRGLEWSDVDLVRGTIKVRWSVKGNKRDTPKSGKNRLVPIGPYLIAILKEWQSKLASTASLVVPAEARKTNKIRASQASTESPRNWSPYLNEAKTNTHLEAALAKLGLTNMTFYQVGRHSFASSWAIQGRDIYQLCRIMGHASVDTTMRYAHLSGLIRPL